MLCKNCNTREIKYSVKKLCESCNKKEWVRNNYEKSRVFHRRYDRSERGKELKRARDKKYRKLNKLKIQARNKLYWAVESGKMNKEPCRVCGDVKVEAHHYHYDDPFNVVWLCLIHQRALYGQTIYPQ